MSVSEVSLWEFRKIHSDRVLNKSPNIFIGSHQKNSSWPIWHFYKSFLFRAPRCCVSVWFSSIYGANNNSVGGQGWENDINIYHLIKGENKKQKKHREEVKQKKLMAALVPGQQCTLGNYKHKGGKKSWTQFHTIVTNKRKSAWK